MKSIPVIFADQPISPTANHQELSMSARRWWGLASVRSQKSPVRTRFGVEALESRDVPAIGLVSAQAGTTDTTANGFSQALLPGSISDDGRYVVFTSLGTNLVTGQVDTNNLSNVYLRDTVTGTTTLISHAAAGAATTGNSDSIVPFISGDGKWVGFWSQATDLISTNTTSGYQLYLYDRVGNSLSLVSHAAGSTTTGAATSATPQAGQLALSDDGSYLAFISDAQNLVAGQTTSDTAFAPNYDDAFVYDRLTGATHMVSHSTSAATTGGNGQTTLLTISGDGTTVAFTSASTNMVTGETGTPNSAALNVFRYVISTDTTTLVTHTPTSATTAVSNPGSNLPGPSISDDGTEIVYESPDPGLVANQVDTGGFFPSNDTFLYNSANGTNVLVSHDFGTTATSSADFLSDSSGSAPIISGDGKWVVFASDDKSLLSTTLSGSILDNLYVYNVATTANALVSHTAGSATTPTNGSFPSISKDGSLVVFFGLDASGTIPAIVEYTTSTGAVTTVANAADPSGSTGTDQLLGEISDDGSTVVFNSDASTLVAHDTNNVEDVFVSKTAASAPTQLALSSTDAPALNSATVGQFSTTAAPSGRVFQYSLVSGPGSTNNAQFVISGNNLLTAPNFLAQFAANPQSTYSILVQTTDVNDPTASRTQQFFLTVDQAPTTISISQHSVPNESSTQFAQLTASGPTSGRTYQYSLVPGFGNNALFAVSLTGAISTVAGFTPPTGITQFVIQVKAQDSALPGLFFIKQFALTPLVQAPTNITSSTAGVPALANTQFAQLTTTNPTSGRTDQYSLVDTTNFPDNLLFSINPTTGALSTVASGFPVSGQTTYTIKVRSADTQFPGLFVDKVLTFTLVNAPTSIQLSNATFTPGSGVTIGTLSVPGSNQMYQYTLVSGFGSDSSFTLTGSTLRTGSGFPMTTPATYSIEVQVTNTQFPGLSFLQQFTVHATAPARPAQPVLMLPSTGVVGFQGAPVLLNISASPGDATSMVSVTISGVPAGVTFSAGTNNGNGSWTFTQAQLAGLMINVPTPQSFTLAVVATATFTSGTGNTSTASGMLPVTVQIATPTITVSAPTFANPSSPVLIGVTSTAPGTEVFQSVTVNWGDGTVQTFPGAPSTYTHQYALANASYTITVSVTDQNGTFTAPPSVVAMLLPTAQQAVVASLYQDLLGRNADPAGLAGWSSQLAAGVPVSQVINGILSSTEYQTKVLNDLFLKYLGRPVDATGIAAWLPVLQTGGPTAVAAGLINSSEFYANAGGTPQGFVQALYLDVLGRMPDPTSAANDVLAIQFGVPRQQIALGVLNSTEAAANAVNQVYETVLGRPADPSALAGWEQLYITNPAGFLSAFLSSAEFAQRAAAGTLPAPTATTVAPGPTITLV
jgi:hypothetical protein